MAEAVFKDKMSPNAKNWVVWSGGYDSTWIVYQTLKTNSVCHTVYFDVEWIDPRKRKIEQACRKRFIEWASKQGWHIIDNVMKWRCPSWSNTDRLPQQSFWMTNAIWMTPHWNTLSFGFHRGDDFWHVLPNYTAIANEMCKAMNKTVFINFPLKWKDKHDVVTLVRSAGIEKYVWTCESPLKGNKACGKCRPCRLLSVCNLYLKSQEVTTNDTTN